LDEERMLAVRKLLSGVARMSNRTRHGWEGRFGRQRIVEMLRGISSAEIVRHGLDKLTTFGLLAGLSEAVLFGLMDELETAGLLETAGSPYPLLTLTGAGEDVMKRGGSLQLRWPSEGTRPGKAAPRGKAQVEEFLQEMGEDKELLDKLKARRKELSQELEIPAYLVFPNKVLAALARLKPEDEASALRIDGIGPKKAGLYLRDFLEIIREHRN
jgi:ATP-dependent DNA helicase RecQ